MSFFRCGSVDRQRDTDRERAMKQKQHIRKYSGYNPKRTWNDLTKKEAFELELEVYKRLQGEPNFPQLLSYDERRLELVISYCGQSLDRLKSKQMVVPDLEQQIDRIADALDRHGIKHLDMLPKNICFLDGQIYLIDFDVAVLDDVPLSDKLSELLKLKYPPGTRTRDLLRRALVQHRTVRT